MADVLKVATAPKDSTFQVRMNSEIKRTVEAIYAKTGMTLTDAFNIFIQQSINVEGLPFLVTSNSKDMLKQQAIAILMSDLKQAVAEIKKAILSSQYQAAKMTNASVLEKELGV